VSPIGVDIGRQSVKLLQMNGDRDAVVQTARCDIGVDRSDGDEEQYGKAVTDALRQAIADGDFHGREAVISLGGESLFVQNVRVPKSAETNLAAVVQREAAGKIPYPIEETDVRFLEAADIRQGDTTRREIVLLACHRPKLDQLLERITAAGLRPVAVDAEPKALLRCYANQYRREEDRQARVMYVHVGSHKTSVVISQDDRVLFVKYIDLGGQQMNDAVASSLGMESSAAAALRGNRGDRRRDQQDSEVASGMAHALRPVLDHLASELSLCIRYHSVTFRGHPIVRVVFGGDEANSQMIESLGLRVNVPCEIGLPFRNYKVEIDTAHPPQWDIATGLALREIA